MTDSTLDSQSAAAETASAATPARPRSVRAKKAIVIDAWLEGKETPPPEAPPGNKKPPVKGEENRGEHKP